MNEHISNKQVTLEKIAYRIYLIAAVFIGLVIAAQMCDTLFKWNYDLFSVWAGPLLWNIWLPCSGVFLIIFAIRRRWRLAVSPVAFLLYILLLITIGPLLISPETARTGNPHGLELFDILAAILGLTYTALNVWLLKQEVATKGGPKP